MLVMVPAAPVEVMVFVPTPNVTGKVVNVFVIVAIELRVVAALPRLT